MTETPKRYFATYFDMVTYPNADAATRNQDRWLNRWQWIVMPKLDLSHGYVVFYRKQNNPEHRATWKSDKYARLQSLYDAYRRTLADQSARRFTVDHEPIVVELSVTEVTDSIGHNRRVTPWPVINRAKNVARRVHRYTI